MYEKYEDRLFYFKLFAVFLVIFGARIWLVHNFGSSIPFWDEWDMTDKLFLPWLNTTLTFSDIFAAHNEHRPVFTRLINLSLFILNDKQWALLAGMVVNVVFSTSTALFLIVVVRKKLGYAVENLLLFSVIVLWSLPYGWENTLWNFQSTWYLMILLTLLALWGLLYHDNFTFKWWLGAICGFFAFFNLASGFSVFLVIIVVKLYLIAVDHGKRVSHLPTLLISIAITCICVMLIPETSSKPISIHEFLWALGSNLAWPWVSHPSLSLLLYLPFVALLVRIILLRRKPSSTELFVLALGGWVILQAIGIAYARGGNVVYIQSAGPNSRYMDILALGIIVNLLAIHLIAQAWYGLPATIKPRLKFYASLWGLLVFSGLYSLMSTGMIGGVSALQWVQVRNVDQLRHTRDFLLTGDINNLKGKRFKHTPYPIPERLANLLSNEQLRSMLPSTLAVPPLLESVTQDNIAFFPNGFYPPTGKYQKEDVLGSYHHAGNFATGGFTSQSIEIKTGFMEIPVAGYLGAKNLRLQLLVEGRNEPVIITPPKLPGESWVSCYIRTPEKPFKLVAIDNHPDLWFAFAMPRGIGTLSYRNMWLLKNGQLLFLIGIALLWLIFIPQLLANFTKTN